MTDSLIEQSAARLFADNVDKTVRDAAERGEFPRALWQLAVDNGFTQVLASEAAGGLGLGWDAAWPLLRGLGYWQVPLPLAETLVAGLLLSRAGLPVPEGPIALIEQGHDAELRVDGPAGAPRLAGRANRVPWARHCTHAAVSLADGRIALVALDTGAAVRIEQGVNHARLPADHLSFVDAPAQAAGCAIGGLAQPALALGALARSIMMVGALEWILEQSVQYANDRVQFGKPIGRNQAIQQPLALLAGDVASARVAALVAAGDAPGATGSPDPARTAFSVAAAKVRVGEAATQGTSIAHQVHGAIGFTHEHALHFATRRLWAWREEFGSDAWWAERLGRAAIAAGSAGFWPALTARRFA
jgi:acyl-CoA dehydrogenase